VPWDGRDPSGDFVPLTNYTVRITAASHGYSEWTKISDEDNNPGLPGNYAWDPVGIAVNRNTNSPEYGRVFVANASPGPNPGFNPGDRVGVLKLNADGSNPSDGAHSTGGWPWAGDGFSPWKLEVSADGQLYAEDGTGNTVLGFDQVISHESRRHALRADNHPAGRETSFHGLLLAGSGPDVHLWMADTNASNSLGVRRWPIGATGMVATNETGMTVVQAGAGSDLDQAPYDMALDFSNRLFVIQHRVNAGDPSPRLLCFPPYTNAILPLTNVLWKVGGGNNSMRGASGVAVNPPGSLVAVAFRGPPVDDGLAGGRTIIFNATNGSVITNIVTDTPGGERHKHLDVAWDNVGNLYDLDNTASFWRVYSPPGSNAATTVALAPLLVDLPPLRPILSAVSYANNQFTLALTGRTNVNYVVQASQDYQAWTAVATNISHDCPTRPITVSAPQGRNFYRAYPVQ
jgi:hypothetical protein